LGRTAVGSQQIRGGVQVNRWSIVVGVGASYGVTGAELQSLVASALAHAGIEASEVSAVATIDSKAGEEAIQQLATDFGVPLRSHPARVLDRTAAPNPSFRVAATVGTPSVAEAAALTCLHTAPGETQPNIVELLVPKTASPRATVAIARHRFDPVDLHHHGDAELSDGLLDLAVNVRPDPMPTWLVSAIGSALQDLARYPNSDPATQAIARRHRRNRAEVLVTAGAAEAFTLIAQGLIRGRALVVHPQFTEPEVALRAAGWQVERLLLNSENEFLFDPALVGDDADVVVLGNPTNPTGTLHSRELLLAVRRPGRVLIVDEAFMDAVPGESESLAGVDDLTGVLVVRSLTKTWGLAGLRIGYVVGDPALIERLATMQPRWAVSTPAIRAAVACMSDEAVVEVERRAAGLSTERERLRIALLDKGFQIARRSEGPFLLVRHSAHEALHAELRKRGIAARRADTFPGLGLGWVRISVRDRAATDQLLGALDSIQTP
jgi:histidinol-phosphate aminotransferase